MRPMLCTARARYALEGNIAAYLRAITDQWLLVAPEANPAMLAMFADRDRKPYRNMVPWAGEFAGKYLTSAVQVLRLTGDRRLKKYIGPFVEHLLRLQDEDGYLGPWPKNSRLTGMAPNVNGKKGQTWDAWGHYHIMLGLLLWHEESGNGQALRCAERMADLFCKKFLGKKRRRLVDTGSTEMNLAVVHVLCLLYKKGKESRYLNLALQLVDEFAAVGKDGQPLAGDYLNQALNGVEFYQTPKPRWESLHPIMALAELYWIAGDECYRRAVEQIWWSIVRLDRHNNGGFSSGEKAQGNPYDQGAIETCCTIAWMALSVEMLKMTGDAVVADELECSLINSGLGLVAQSGRWVTYNTPMDGVRKASAHDIVFQSRAGSPELNCCSVNGPRGLALLSDWALMRDAEGLRLNWYGAGCIETELKRGLKVKLVQKTDYPRSGCIELRVSPSRASEFALKLRIPHWSARTHVRVNGTAIKGVEAGSYLGITRSWRRGDRIDIELDMSMHYWLGEKECRGKIALYRGPVLLTYDRRFNACDPHEIPVLDANNLRVRTVQQPGAWMAVDYRSDTGEHVRLCDFASAGEGGAPYISWLPAKNGKKTAFSRQTPLRSRQVKK